MMPMRSSARAVAIAVVLLAIIGGILYAYLFSIPVALAAPLVAAFALEAGLYFGLLEAAARKALAERGAPALWLMASGLAPYLVYAAPTGAFRWPAFGALAALCALIAFWYLALPWRPATDLLFVAVVAAGLLADVFPRIYLSPVPKLPLAILGQLMWTRLAIVETLAVARIEVKGFGFLPERGEWLAGLRNYVLFVPCGVLLGWTLGFASFHPRSGEWWQNLLLAAATFLGMFWVVALREEFFFRGLLQDWLTTWLRGEWPGLIAASLLFGAAHLWFRVFPNWRFAVLAAVAGFFYGRAYLEARSVRAAMVTHALVNVTWRMLFS